MQNVSTHSRPKAAGTACNVNRSTFYVSTHSRPKAAGTALSRARISPQVSTHSRPKAAGISVAVSPDLLTVSTHSRPKAAGGNAAQNRAGAITVSTHSRPKAAGSSWFYKHREELVSTHSRPKAAGLLFSNQFYLKKFQHTAARRRLGRRIGSRHRRRDCFNTQPPEGGWPGLYFGGAYPICFNTQPPEGGWIQPKPSKRGSKCFNTQPPEGGWANGVKSVYKLDKFQHTAARRRLARVGTKSVALRFVSTHSRPKAAGFQRRIQPEPSPCFNTQPPEGGWLQNVVAGKSPTWVSTHSRPKAAGSRYPVSLRLEQFQHTAARRRLA